MLPRRINEDGALAGAITGCRKLAKRAALAYRLVGFNGVRVTIDPVDGVRVTIDPTCRARSASTQINGESDPVLTLSATG